MNIAFFGSSGFAVHSLGVLLSTPHKISCVVTQPDRLKGRGLHLEGTAVKNLAIESKLRIYQPKNINSQEAIKTLKALNTDLFVLISYGQILSEEILKLPKIMAINAHASVLPKYRGAAPINRAIIRGDKTSGVTIIKMTEKMDAGPIIAQEAIDIEEADTSISLQEKLSKLSAVLLIKALEVIEKKAFNLIPQDESKVSLAPKLKKEDGLIDWDKSAIQIHNLIRGCLAWPGAYTYYREKLLKIYRAEVIKSLGEAVIQEPGEIIGVSKAGIMVATGDGNLMINELQIEGKKAMRTTEFIAGHNIMAGEMLGR